ncbi:toxin-antitoxin system HicB family antitoxin [Clostridium sp. MD294]|uniref:toxin-antitoxin system HicB family antitoxin n=1 Tax=Clostridium sp. MD294 TaxID=97138 RepID=UPI0002C91D0A|nr:toxin-antitoxin system HicB family antitoxin [Clostridium sp. MD294]NDO47594.1 toxin-antitoxin system HicB family antitoxin [Clostridium sp. MD294]USF29331.1 hypothetical protein C820_000721 [Clostridium sp. MD294]
MSKTSSIVKDKYNEKAYNNITLRVQKGLKENIQNYAASKGESLNAFINRAINQAMEKESEL